jgi:hypothetical protein
MAGPVPAIHVFCFGFKDVDARDKPGHDAYKSPHLYRIAAEIAIGIMDERPAATESRSAGARKQQGCKRDARGTQEGRK